MIYFIKCFLMMWANYPGYRWFCYKHLTAQQLKEIGGDPYKNRFDYAWHNAKIQWNHRDRYSKKCTGECESCKLKHC